MLELGHGLTLIRGGGHFPGGTMLHRAEGAGELLTGDIIQVIPDRAHVGVHVELSRTWCRCRRPRCSAIAAAVEPFEFDAIYGAWWDRIIPSGGQGGRAALGRALRRALRGELL